MEKLELKHIAPYLPYNLELEIINYKCDYVGIQHSYINGFYYIGNSLHVTYSGGATGKSVDEFKIKLRPLSELIHEIEHNGERFVVAKALGVNPNWYRFDYWASNYNIMRYDEIQRLFEWHFDVFGLIEKGLAIEKK